MNLARPPERVHGARGAWLALMARARPGLPLLAVGGALYLGLFYGLGAFPLFDVDEGAFSEATREMRERGDLIIPWLNGAPRFDKPILIYWLQALSVSVLGVNELAFRLPSALAGVAWVLAIQSFARAQGGTRAGQAAALLAATTLGVCVIGRAATADALLNLFLALTMFDLYRHLAAPCARYRWRVYLWMALGLLAKGPLAVLVPAVAGGVLYHLHGRARLWWRAVRDPVGWAIVLGLAGPWYWLAWQRMGAAFLEGLFLHHHVERFLSPLQGHGGSLLYYAPVLLFLLLPYSGLLLRVLPGLRRWRTTPLDSFLWCWFLFVLLFFSLAATKLPHYLLYGVTPLLVLMALQRERLHSRLLAFAPGVLWLLTVAMLPAITARLAAGSSDAAVRALLGQPAVFSIGWRATAALLLAAALAVACWPRARLWPRLAGMGLICTAAAVGLVLPAAAALQQGPVREAALLARAAGWPVRSWQVQAPSFSVYRGAVTEPASRPQPGDVLLTRPDALVALGPHVVLYRKGNVVLVRLGAGEAAP